MRRLCWRLGREVLGRIGYCFHRSAFQSETQDEFRARIRLSVEAYEQPIN